ncbi:glycosyltransferase family 2 protein [Candidatus Aerophobetes bacterium]|nr:glycosyltransferase family 2 protein [Candidatus Aerophobetes bacterium]
MEPRTLDEVDLAILIVSYNTRELLKSCLSSVYQKTRGIKFEVIVVDNGSSDNSVKMIRKEFPQVKLIENRENLGFARANNQAIKQSRARYFLLFNPDTSFKDNSPHEMIKFMDNHPQVGILGCKILNTDGTIQPSNASFPNLFTEFLRAFQLKKLIPGVRARGKIGEKWSGILGSTLKEYLRVYWDSETIREVDWVTGACLLARRKAIEEVGLLDENFFMYYEDADWCYRMRKKDWKTYYFPFFEVVHYVGKSDSRFSPRTFIERHKSMYYYFRKHKGKKAVFLLRLFIFGGLALRWVGLLVIYPFTKKKQAELRKGLYAYLKVIEIRGF